MTDFDLPLPTIAIDATFDWQWPRPPVACDVPDARPDGAEPCRIDTGSGVSVVGELVHFDADAQQLRFRLGRGGEPLVLPFTKFRRLTLTTPWRLTPPAPGAPVERLPAAAQERSFVATLVGGGSIIGHTQGRVEHAAGTFLFVPAEDGPGLLRQFIPSSACISIEFGASGEERAEQRWVATREGLLAAIAAQGRARMMPLGEALLELGLVSREVLDQAMRAPGGASGEMPLGERLVFQGHIDRSDLNTALAHKMGYPMVNLTSFPIDAQAARLLSVATMLEFRALPLMSDGTRLVVAVDDLASIGPLQALKSLAGREVVPVLAPRGRLSIALAQAAQDHDLWAHNVPPKP